LALESAAAFTEDSGLSSLWRFARCFIRVGGFDCPARDTGALVA